MSTRFENGGHLAIAVRLLAGTSLAALSIVLAQPALAQTALPPVQVQGEASGSYTATASDLDKLPEPLLDTPVAVTTVTRQLMDDRGVTNLNDALRNVPSITLEAGESSWQGNAPYIRGFSARTDMFLDGMRDIGNYYRDPWNLEDVQVLEGPDSILFGRGSTGGVIEQASKRPSMDAFTAASVSAGTADLQRATVDIDAPIDGLGTPAAFRLNLMGNSNGVAEREVTKFGRYGFAPSLALGLGTPTRLDVSYFHQTENDTPDFGIPWYFGSPAPVDQDNFYGFRSDHLNATADIGTVKAAHDFSDTLTLRDQFRYADYGRSETGSKPAIPASATPATPLNTINVAINAFTVNSTERQLQNQTDLLAKFDTGPVHHDLTAGVEYDDESSAPQVFNSSGLTNNLLNPNTNQIFNPTATYPRVKIDTTTNTTGVYAMDTMKLGDQWQLVLGGRFDRFSVHFHELAYSVPPATMGVVTANNALNHVDEMPSWHGALLYKPAENGTIYFTYATSFNPSAETLDEITSFTSFSLNNENLAPEKTRTFELGTKWSLLGDRLTANASLFQTDKYNARIPDPSIPGFNMLAGDQQVQGFELQAQGWITDAWNLSLGYDYLNSDTTRTIAGGPPLGLPLPFVARDNFTFWSTYQIMPGFQIGGGGQYVGPRYAQTTAPIEKAPGYVEFDAMAKYALSPKFDLQVNVYNIADNYYYDMLHPAFIIPGAGRSAMLTLNYHS
ncbi:MAG TPA: TonB-dependent siderophore receptor [Rhizomicrobium sp.]|nr:TonB-dependent siderophore receptor [Rhizomicrobium sp.]